MILDELIIGKTVEGQNMTAHVADGKWNKYFYFLAGVIGDEVEGVYVLQKLIKEMASNIHLQEFPIVIIPIFNLDGHQRLLPNNSQEVDLYHHFLFQDQYKKLTPESEALIELFKKFPPAYCLNFKQGVSRLTYQGEISKVVASHLGKSLGLDIEKERQSENKMRLSHYLIDQYQAGTISLYLPINNDELALNDIWKYCRESLYSLFRNDYIRKICHS
ncbi:MAG: M14 family zinc carboxypeptidase [Bacteriovoracaceae bacterium]|nr:M14 family zinc carboxypeptidase [Bacteriovoracaceae bacterium]